MKQCPPQPRGIRGERKIGGGDVVERKGRTLFETVYKGDFKLVGIGVVKRIAQRIRRGAMSAAGVGKKDEDATHG